MMRGALCGIARIATGLTFVYAALTKLGDLASFAEEVANYQILPPALVPSVAVALPGIELLAGVLLLLGVATRAAASVLALLLGVFIAGLSQALLRGVNLRCGCFGGSDLATWSTVARDAVILVAALLPALGGTGRFALVRPPASDP